MTLACPSFWYVPTYITLGQDVSFQQDVLSQLTWDVPMGQGRPSLRKGKIQSN